MRWVVILPFLGLFFVPIPAPAGKVNLEQLLNQMVDLRQLAEYPHPPFVTRQFSSYDRSSVAPADAEGWFANHDRGHVLYEGILKQETPVYRNSPVQAQPPDGKLPKGTKVGLLRARPAVGDYVCVYTTGPDGVPQLPGYVPKSAIEMNAAGPVLAEMDGPGCLVRLWSSTPGDAGRVRIYLDHAKEPTIEAKLQDLLGGTWETEVEGGRFKPFPDPFAGERARGWNLYFPIAYAQHCKVCADRPDINYHVNYRTYPQGTEIETLSLAVLLQNKERIAAAAKLLAERTPRAPSSLASRQSFEGRLARGEKGALFRRAGPGAIVGLRFQVRADQLAEALRSLVLIGRFDDATEPSIHCPLGDFFGTSPGANAFASLPIHVLADGTFVSNWFMPFARSTEFELHNLGLQPVDIAFVAYSLGDGAYHWTDRSMHFHAKWRMDYPLHTRPHRDWTLGKLAGQGVYVGTMLSVLNPVGAWWGEGDEKITVDGERFPSHFGTGTDDYFGGGWCCPELFQHAYHNQTRCDGPGNFGHCSLNRFHVLDAIPFRRGLQFDLEVWHWSPVARVSYAATCYWYARPGAKDDFVPPRAEQLQFLPTPPPLFRIDGAMEAEKMRVLGKSSPFPLDPQAMLAVAGGPWSNGGQLWARPARKGEWVDLEVPVAAAGRYRVIVYPTRAPEYGIIQFQVNGGLIGKPVDGFVADKVVAAGPVDLGEVELPKGNVALRVTVLDTNAQSVGLRYAWGLDCVVLKPAAQDRP